MIQNPVIPGFNPDSSFVRVDEDYYIANSTFEWFPGVQIHHSRDLSNWRLIGHALTRESQLDLRGIVKSGGVWAPCLSYHDNQFWLIYTPNETPSAPRTHAPVRDDFASEILDVNWSSLRDPVDGSWISLSARPGWLRLHGRDSPFSLFRQSLLPKRLTSFRCIVETCVEFGPDHFTQKAGLICYYDTRQHYYLRITHDEARGKVLGIVVTDDGAYDELLNSQIPISDWSQTFLRAEIGDERLQFSASPDGEAWKSIGPVLDMLKLSDDYGSTLRFTGAMIGLCVQDVGGTFKHADFDYFEMKAAPPGEP